MCEWFELLNKYLHFPITASGAVPLSKMAFERERKGKELEAGLLFVSTEWQDVNGVVVCNDDSWCQKCGRMW